MLRVLGFGLSFLFNIILARQIDLSQVGVYFQAFTMVSFAVAFSQLGLNTALLRFIAAEAQEEHWGQVRSIARTSILASVTASILTTSLILVTAPLLMST